ncbi:MAG: cysteine desulfurase [Lachnospiraceae bacterium]|nr:cysteine desulfurase [Lachnospiraceae bacterium]
MAIYFDNAATSQVLPEVIEEISSVMSENYGNPSSRHAMGIKAEEILKKTREVTASSLNVKAKEIIFTSGGTEANNQIFTMLLRGTKHVGKHIITSCIEHSAVLEPLAFLEKQGFRVTYLPVDKYGHVSAEDLKNSICEDTSMVSIMYVNNEIGSINNIKELGEVIKEANKGKDVHDRILFHTDAIQAYGKLKISPKLENIDLLSVSGHKFHGPKGIGFLFVDEKVIFRPLIFGGGQEGGFRSGTENVPGIAGLRIAIEKAYEDIDGHERKMRAVKNYIINELKSYEDVSFNGLTEGDMKALEETKEDFSDEVRTSPHILSILVKGVRSEVLLNALSDKGIYVSSGSACSSNRPELSGTLKNIGVEEEDLDSVIRLSFSRFNTIEEAKIFVEEFKKIVPALRRFTRR